MLVECCVWILVRRYVWALHASLRGDAVIGGRGIIVVRGVVVVEGVVAEVEGDVVLSIVVLP